MLTPALVLLGTSAQNRSKKSAQQDFLKLDLPDNHFDGVFANAALFHVPSQELPRVLLELHASLKPGGVLLSSNPHGHNEEGWNGGRYGVYHDLDVWRRYVSAAFGQTEIKKESVIVPFSLLQYYTGTPYFRTLVRHGGSLRGYSEVTAKFRRFCSSRHRASAHYRVENSTGILETARQIALALMVVLILIALIALVISGVGIMNIMLVTVTERTREIGIRKAIGATQDAIRYQFLMEAMAISGTGALAGIAIGVAIPGAAQFPDRLYPRGCWYYRSRVVDLGCAGVRSILLDGLDLRLSPRESRGQVWSRRNRFAMNNSRQQVLTVCAKALRARASACARWPSRSARAQDRTAN